MVEKCALIVTDEKSFSPLETFSFYNFKIKEKSSLYNKIYENVSIDGINFNILSIPIPKNIKKKHVDFIDSFIKSKKPSSVYYKWKNDNQKIAERLNNGKNKISCARLFSIKYLFKSYCKMLRISNFLANVVLICDYPHLAADIIKEICREVSSFYIYTRHPEMFNEITDYFLSEYGILLKAGDTLEGVPERNLIILAKTDDKNLIGMFKNNCNKDILNLDFNSENIIFSGTNNINSIAKLCGKFDMSVLYFIFSAYNEDIQDAGFMRFIHKFDIKTIKFVKND